MSDVLVKSDLWRGSCSSITSKSSSIHLHDAAVTIAGSVVEALDKLVESNMIDCKSDADTIIRSLDAFDLNRSDISEGVSRSTPFNLHTRVRGYLQDLFTTSVHISESSLKHEGQTTVSTQDVPISELQLSRDLTVSHLDDLTIICMSNIFGEIERLFHSDLYPECQAPAGDETVYGIIQGLGELVRSSRSSPKSRSSDRGLDECKDVSVCSVERVFSAQFKTKAAQTLSDILLKTGEKLSTSEATQSSEAFCLTDFQPNVYALLEELEELTVTPSVPASPLSIQANSTASDIMDMFLSRLRKCSLTIPKRKNFLSASRSIYRGVQKKVFGFFLRLQESFSTHVNGTKGGELESIKAPHTTAPRFQVDLDSSTDELMVKIVDLYKSEVLLTKPSSPKLSHIRHSMSSQSTSPHDLSTADEERICSSISKQSSDKLKTVKPKEILTESVRVVRDVLMKRVTPQISSDEFSQSSLDSIRGTSATPCLSTSSTDLENAAVTIAETVVDAIDRYNEVKHSEMAAVKSSSDMLSDASF